MIIDQKTGVRASRGISHKLPKIAIDKLGSQRGDSSRLLPRCRQMLFDIDKVFWKYGTFSRLFHWLKRDYDTLLGGLPERSLLLRQLKTQQVHTDLLMAQPRMLNVVDSFPIELIFPIRQGRSKAQLGTKSRDKGRWSVGIKVAWILNTFLDYLADCNEIMLTDWGFRCADGLPQNVKVCKKGTWTDRMAVEAAFSMLTVICKAKKIR